MVWRVPLLNALCLCRQYIEGKREELGSAAVHGVGIGFCVTWLRIRSSSSSVKTILVVCVGEFGWTGGLQITTTQYHKRGPDLLSPMSTHSHPVLIGDSGLGDPPTDKGGQDFVRKPLKNGMRW